MNWETCNVINGKPEVVCFLYFFFHYLMGLCYMQDGIFCNEDASKYRAFELKSKILGWICFVAHICWYQGMDHLTSRTGEVRWLYLASQTSKLRWTNEIWWHRNFEKWCATVPPRITTVIEVTGVAPLTNHCTSLTSSVDLDPPGYMHSGTCMISVNQDYHYPFR
jgi:hypothetical protein